jgi:hypothetical protein
MNDYQMYQYADEDYLGLIASVVKDICLSFRSSTYGYFFQDRFLV